LNHFTAIRHAARMASDVIFSRAVKCIRRSGRHINRLSIEAMEPRQYLSTEVYLTDDPGINNYDLRVSGGNVQIFQNQPLTATPIQQVPVADIGSVNIEYNGSNDNVTLDYSGVKERGELTHLRAPRFDPPGRHARGSPWVRSCAHLLLFGCRGGPAPGAPGLTLGL
jgi:hypothetical protein